MFLGLMCRKTNYYLYYKFILIKLYNKILIIICTFKYKKKNLQFLMDHNFDNTAGALMVEATIKGFKYFKKDLQSENEIYENLCKELMINYKTGNLKTFFKV